jgi:hypothetical protein
MAVEIMSITGSVWLSGQLRNKGEVIEVRRCRKQHNDSVS